MKSVFLLVALLPSSFLVAQTPEIWGVATGGGTNDLGTIFRVSTDDLTAVEAVHSFSPSNDGSGAPANLEPLGDGWYYGCTANGGNLGGGVVFRTSLTGEFQQLYHLDPELDGTACLSGLTAQNGTLYGVTSAGGANDVGTLFSFNPISGNFNVLVPFDASSTGGTPQGKLLIRENGDIVGTCSSGGAQNAGTLFHYSDNTLEVLHHFNEATDGSFPQAGLTESNNGVLYGTAQFGGENSQGTIYSFSQSEGFQVLYALNEASSDGRYPLGQLLFHNNFLFGLCSEGGTNSAGTIFQINETGVFEKLHDFSGTLHGSTPRGGLIARGDSLYGVCRFGGQNSYGTLFQYALDGSFEVLVNMNYTNTGINPFGTPAIVGDSALIGLTSGGGLADAGTFWRYNFTDGFTKLYDLNLPLEGTQPQSRLSFQNNRFYGSTQFGGLFNSGTVFDFAPGAAPEIKHSMNGTSDGRNVPGDILVQDDLILGTTLAGGTSNWGTIFKIEDGEYTVLHAFNSPTDGSGAQSGLCAGGDGWFYGTTINGGTFSRGTLFRINTAGDFEVLHHFNAFTDGGRSYGTLLFDGESTFYGTCREGGMSNGGTIYKYSTAEGFTVLHNFSPFTDGRFPQSGVIFSSDSTALFGLCAQGGGNNTGTLYSFNLGTSTFLTLANLDAETGGNAQGEPVLYSEQLYFATNNGGANSAGTLSSFDLALSTLTTHHNFSATTGENPIGGLYLFIPVCTDDAACDDGNPCTVDVCNQGICQSTPINPVFTVTEVGDCEPGSTFSLTLNLELDVNPGGSIEINGAEFELSDELSQQFLLPDLEANGQAVTISYTFTNSGCAGVAENLLIAPEACASSEVTFTVFTNAIDLSSNGLHVAGTFNNWDATEFELQETGENIYSTTVNLFPGEYEFNYVNGNALIFAESVDGSCAENGKRLLTITEQTGDTIYASCYALCSAECTNSLSNQALLHFQAYPNPGSDVLVLEGLPDSGTVEVFSTEGRIVLTRSIYSGREEFNTAYWAQGLYIIQVRAPSAAGSLRWIKQ